MKKNDRGTSGFALQPWVIIIQLVALTVLAGCSGERPRPLDGALLWQYGTSNPGELVIMSPSVADGVVYAGSYEGSVYALNTETGELLWRFDAGAGLNPPPQVAGGVLYAEKERGGSHALDASIGELLSGDESVSEELLLSDSTIYSWIERNFSVHIRAVDVASEEELWAADVPRSSELPLLFPVTASGEMIFVSDENQVHALDSATGESVWSFEAGDADGGIVQDPPAGSNGMVYLRSYSAAYALEESTGKQLWKYDIDYDYWGRPPYIVDGVWTLVGLDVLHGLDAATGRILWSFEEDRASFVSGIAEGMVFVTGDEAFYALDAATGKELWSLDADWHIGEVKVVDGVLYANSLDGYFHTLDARTGEPIWSVEIGYHHGGPGKPYVISGGVVYVSYQLEDSGIYAFTAPDGR